MNFPILSVTLFAPLAGALLILIVPQEDVKTVRRVGIAFAFLTLILTTVIGIGVVRAGASEMQYSERYSWIPAFDIWYAIGVDGLSAPLLLLTALLTTLSLFYSAHTIETRVKEYYLLFLVLEMGLFGAFMALDLVLFLVSWEVGLVPMFLIIGVWGGGRRDQAALKFFLYTLLGSAITLLVIIGIFFQTGTFGILEAAAARPFAGNFTWGCMAFWALFAAFAIMLPSFPLHTWLPDAQTEAPTAGSVMLAGSLIKLGAYGLIRIALPLFPEPFHYFVVDVPIIPVVAVISIVYGALVCMAQGDFKRLVAYSSVPHMGYVTLGVCAAVAGINELSEPATLNAAASGLNGAAMQMFVHGIIVGGMFFLVGILSERAHIRDLKAFGGLAVQTPYYYAITLVTSLAALGLPGLAGFWSQLFVYRSAARFIPLAAFIGISGIIFTAAYVLWKIVQHIFLGPLDKQQWGTLPDMAWWEKVTMWPLVLIMVILGLYPAPLLDMFNAATTALLNRLS